MKSSINISRFFQARIRLHYSWILVVILISLAVATQFPTESSLWLRIALGVATAVFFFLAMIIRELILLIIAVYKGVAIESVTVFAFGGLLQFDRDTTTPSHELLLAVAGMLCNLIIAGIFYFAYVLQGDTAQIMIDVILKWLAFIYFTLTLFHIIPAFPLEGGRILHTILWKALNDIRQATRISSWIGWTSGLILVAGGIFILTFTVERFTGAFSIGIGLILQNAATHSRRQQNQITIPIPSNSHQTP
ncbi:site-2 protease family protein [Chloroflexota bacterium]